MLQPAVIIRLSMRQIILTPDHDACPVSNARSWLLLNPSILDRGRYDAAGKLKGISPSLAG